jgi:DNA-binding XRE family transcriptional regulator
MAGHKLRGKRIALGLTQAQLAEILDVKPDTVARRERGLLSVPRTVELAMETVEHMYRKSSKK